MDMPTIAIGGGPPSAFRTPSHPFRSLRWRLLVAMILFQVENLIYANANMASNRSGSLGIKRDIVGIYQLGFVAVLIQSCSTMLTYTKIPKLTLLKIVQFIVSKHISLTRFLFLLSFSQPIFFF